MIDLPPICILAGGLGTRLGDDVSTTPKPLLDVAGEPFLVHQLRLLASSGATDVVLCVGYLGEHIEARIGREQCGIRIEYSYDGPQLAGTLGAIRGALRLLPDRFLVLYGDTYLRVDYRDAAETWLASGKLGLMTVLHNSHRWGPSNAVVQSGLVRSYDKVNPTPEMEWIDYGLGGLDADAVSLVDSQEADLSVLQGRLAVLGELCGYEAHERFFEIGTPEALAETAAFLEKTAGHGAGRPSADADVSPG